MSNVQFFSQFCDDVRREQDGRTSLMGIYPGSVQIDLGANTTIPRLWIHATLTIPLAYPLESIAILVQWNDKTFQQFDLPPDALLEFHNQKASASKAATGFILNFAFEIKGLAIGDGGTLRAVVDIGPEKVKGLPLRISNASGKKET